MSSGDFDADRYRRLAQTLAEALDAQPADSLWRAAKALEVSEYPPGKTLPFNVRFPPTQPLTDAYATLADLKKALRAGAPDAFEAALEALTAVDPERAAEIGEQVLADGLWPEAKDRAAFALSKSRRPEAFAALLGAIGDVGRAGFLLTQSPFEGGGDIVSRKLAASPILKYEPAKIPSRAEWEATPSAARKAEKARADKAAAAFPFADVNVARSLMEYLGSKRWTAAQPLIARLYTEHPSDKVRLAAGHALVALGDSASLDLLTSLADSSDSWQRWFASKAAIAKDPASAVERLGGDALKTKAARERMSELFEILRLDATEKDKSGGAPWLLADPRWRDVLQFWLDNREHAAVAEALLHRLPEASSGAAKGATKGAAKAPKGGNAAKAATGSGGAAKGGKAAKAATEKSAAKGKSSGGGLGALALFQAGDGPGAWQKLLALGDRVREPEHIDEARQVAAATMLAARANLEKIVQRLKESGYRFLRPNKVLEPPPADVAAKLDELEAEVGPLPLSLRAAFEHLGVVDLVGDHPSWPKSGNVRLRSVRDESEVWFTDPLMITSVDAVLEDVFEGGVKSSITFAGDPYTKAGYSGDIYKVKVPCPAADAKIDQHPQGLTFVEHLRIGLQNGGLAGFATIAGAPRPFIDELVKGLRPI